MRPLPLLLLLASPILAVEAQAARIPPPTGSPVTRLAPTPATAWQEGRSGLPVEGMALGAAVLGIPAILCAIRNDPHSSIDCDLKTVIAAAAMGALLGGLAQGLLAPAQPKDTTAWHPLGRLRPQPVRRASGFPWQGTAIGGVIGWGLVNSFCDTENPDDHCGGEKLQVGLVGAAIGAVVDLFVRNWRSSRPGRAGASRESPGRRCPQGSTWFATQRAAAPQIEQAALPSP